MSYGRSKPGRPPANTEAERATPRCEKCKHMRVNEDRSIVCGHFRALEPVGCTDYTDISRPRIQIFGGITGVAFER